MSNSELTTTTIARLSVRCWECDDPIWVGDPVVLEGKHAWHPFCRPLVPAPKKVCPAIARLLSMR